jgi:hypothetical protein
MTSDTGELLWGALMIAVGVYGIVMRRALSKQAVEFNQVLLGVNYGERVFARSVVFGAIALILLGVLRIAGQWTFG